jgi:hypothetical protein
MGSISINGCNVTALGFYPPADKTIEYVPNDWLITGSGYLINITPHIHDGATNAKFFRNGELVCTIDAVYGEDKGSTTIGGESWQMADYHRLQQRSVLQANSDQTWR